MRSEWEANRAIDRYADQVPEDHREVLEAVLALPDKYRDVVYLH